MNHLPSIIQPQLKVLKTSFSNMTFLGNTKLLFKENQFLVDPIDNCLLGLRRIRPTHSCPFGVNLPLGFSRCHFKPPCHDQVAFANYYNLVAKLLLQQKPEIVKVAGVAWSL